MNQEGCSASLAVTQESQNNAVADDWSVTSSPHHGRGDEVVESVTEALELLGQVSEATEDA